MDNKTYSTTNLPLNFTVNEPFNNPSYSLDGNQSVEIEGNTTLVGLTSGSHSLSVQVQDRAGNIGTSETVFFSVRIPETFPTLSIALMVIVILAVAVALTLFYRRPQR